MAYHLIRPYVRCVRWPSVTHFLAVNLPWMHQSCFDDIKAMRVELRLAREDKSPHTSLVLPDDSPDADVCDVLQSVAATLIEDRRAAEDEVARAARKAKKAEKEAKKNQTPPLTEVVQ